jgi:hypothetical protein
MPTSVTAHRPHSRKAPHPGFTRASPSRDTAAAQRCVYDGQHRLGSYSGHGSTWTAVDRLGRPIGVFGSEIEATNAISAAAEGRT